MVKEIVSVFADVPEGVFIDATIGLGGHALAIERNLTGKFIFLGFDRDGEMIGLAREKLPASFRLFKMTYSKIPSMLEAEIMGPVTGVLFGLGGAMILGTLFLWLKPRHLLVLTIILFIGTELLHPNPDFWNSLAVVPANLMLVRPNITGFSNGILECAPFDTHLCVCAGWLISH